MYDAFLMQVGYAYHQLSCVEFGNLLRESLFILEYSVEFSAVNKWHYDINTCLSLKEVFHAAEKWVVCTHEDLQLKLYPFN